MNGSSTGTNGDLGLCPRQETLIRAENPRMQRSALSESLCEKYTTDLNRLTNATLFLTYLEKGGKKTSDYSSTFYTVNHTGRFTPFSFPDSFLQTFFYLSFNIFLLCHLTLFSFVTDFVNTLVRV